MKKIAVAWTISFVLVLSFVGALLAQEEGATGDPVVLPLSIDVQLDEDSSPPPPLSLPVDLTYTLADRTGETVTVTVPVLLELDLTSSTGSTSTLSATVPALSPFDLSALIPGPTPVPGDYGERSNPVPYGEPYVTGDGLQLRMVDYVADAWTEIEAENMFNEEPDAGVRMAMGVVEVTNVDGSADVATLIDWNDFALVGDMAVVYDEGCGVLPNQLDAALYDGGSVTGAICRQVAEDDTGLLAVYVPSADDRVFMVMEPPADLVDEPEAEDTQSEADTGDEADDSEADDSEADDSAADAGDDTVDEAETAAPVEDEPVDAAPTVDRSVNLRGGPGTEFAVVGSMQPGDTFAVIGKNEDGSWFQVETEAGEIVWLAAFLAVNGPDADDVAVAEEIPAPPPTPTPAPPSEDAAAPSEDTAEPAADADSATSGQFPGIDEWVEAGGWRFKVSEVHKRKAVYFYDESKIAFGNWVVLIVDAVNLQSGTDYFDRNLDPYLTDGPGNVYPLEGTATSFAAWQYGGVGNPYRDMTPGRNVRFAAVYDVPEGAGQILWSLNGPVWINLGDVDALPLEE